MATLSPAGGVGHWVRRPQVQAQVQMQPRLTSQVAAWLDESPSPRRVDLALVGQP
jgi:hypothetical protein